MDENGRKHLEFIQGIITRHNSNSFMIKGWAITISAALYALAGTVKTPEIVFIATIPILLFWGLDAFYLSNERSFIDLYNAVVKGSIELPDKTMFKKKYITQSTKNDIGSVPVYNMNFKQFKIWKDNCWFYVLWSKSIFWLYFPMLILTILIGSYFITYGTFKNISSDEKNISESYETEINIPITSLGFPILPLNKF